MVTGTIPLHKLIQYSYAITGSNGDWFIFYYTPDGVTQYKIKLNATSKALLQQKQTEFLAFLDQNVTLTGTIEETWKFQDVTIPASTTKQWVKQ